MNTEDLIRATLARQADLAPPPGQALAALRRPKRRRKPIFLVIGATVAAAAVVVAAVTIPANHQAVDAPPAATVSTTRAEPASFPTLPLHFGVTWLPDGFTEKFRTAQEGSSAERRWTKGDDVNSTTAPTVTLSISPLAKNKEALAVINAGSLEDVISVGGKPARYLRGSGTTESLMWLPTPDFVATVSTGNVPDQREVERWVADGVHPDETVVVRLPLWLHSAGVPSHSVVGTSPADWTAEVGGTSGTRNYRVVLTTKSSVPTGGTKVTAHGRDATYYEAKGDEDLRGQQRVAMLSVPLDGGRYLEVIGASATAQQGSSRPLTSDELAEIANGTAVDQNPDFSWLGTR